MVRLTMTPSIVEGLRKIAETDNPKLKDTVDETATTTHSDDDAEPPLQAPKVGNPITHGQILDLRNQLREAGHTDYTLEKLLRGAKAYIPPPAPKPEPSPEYKALMARLRREEEERSYERMLNQPAAGLSRADAFARQFPSAQASFAEVNRPMNKADEGDGDVTYNDVHRQLMLILNFMVSIFGVAATIWVAARWWSTPARLFVTMGGALVVGIAEVAVYSGYIWRMGEAKVKQEKEKEVKEIVQTWEVGGEKADKNDKEKGAKEGAKTDAVEEKVLLLDKKEAEATTEQGVRERLKREAEAES